MVEKIGTNIGVKIRISDSELQQSGWKHSNGGLWDLTKMDEKNHPYVAAHLQIQNGALTQAGSHRILNIGRDPSEDGVEYSRYESDGTGTRVSSTVVFGIIPHLFGVKTNQSKYLEDKVILGRSIQKNLHGTGTEETSIEIPINRSGVREIDTRCGGILSTALNQSNLQQNIQKQGLWSIFVTEDNRVLRYKERTPNESTVGRIHATIPINDGLESDLISILGLIDPFLAVQYYGAWAGTFVDFNELMYHYSFDPREINLQGLKTNILRGNPLINTGSDVGKGWDLNQQNESNSDVPPWEWFNPKVAFTTAKQRESYQQFTYQKIMPPQ